MASTFFFHDDMTLPESGGDFDTALLNYFRLSKKIRVRDGFVCKQVHGTEILSADNVKILRPLIPTVIGEGDALWTSKKNIWVGVFTADCQALLFDAGDRVMAVHAGWRGLAGGIIEKAVEFLEAESIVSVTLGPSAKKCCYEVGDEVVEAINKRGIVPVMNGKKLDLPETCKKHLLEFGVSNINFSKPFGCTICNTSFRSFRRSGANAGRSLSGIAMIDR